MPNGKLAQYNHVDLLYPSKYLKAADLRGKDVTVTIEDIDPREELTMRGGAKDYKPVVKLRGAKKTWIMNKTNARTIAKMYGNEVTEWIGKAITLFPDRVRCGAETVDAVRVRDEIPKKNGKKPLQIDDDIGPIDSSTHDVASEFEQENE